MKTLLLITVFIVSQTLCSQEIRFASIKSFEVENPNKSEFTEFEKLFPVEITFTKNNSEGKYLIAEPENKIVKENFIKYNNATNSTKSITTTLKREFIRKIVIKELLELNANDNSITSLYNDYGDKSIDIYRNYALIENKLIKSIELSEDVELQIGNSIYPYLQQLYKSEIDKTLNSSLNLLAINF